MMEAAGWIKKGKHITYSPRMLAGTVRQLQEQLVKGYGKDFMQIAYDSPDYGELRHLEENIYQFSAAKNYQQLKDMTLALKDGERIVPEEEFFDRVKAMNLKYNEDWLRTERHTAIAGGQMASRWVEFERDKEIMPLLEYSTVGDERVRAGHAALDGVRKPVDDTFWLTYYPPNGYNCRCNVVAVWDDKAEATPDERVFAPEIPELFKTNLAKQGLIFPQEHPYFNGVPKAEIRKAIAYLPPENGYHAVKGETGERIRVHVLHNTEESAKNLAVADDLARAGYKDIRLLPDIHVKEAHLRKRFLPEGYVQKNPAKNPDACITNKEGEKMVCDFKVLQGERNFSHRIAQAARQAEYAVIKFNFKPEKLGIANIERNVQLQMQEHPELKGVIVLDKEGKVIFERFKNTTADN